MTSENTQTDAENQAVLDENMDNTAYCACLKVSYSPIDWGDGSFSERWRCDSCGQGFKPESSHTGSFIIPKNLNLKKVMIAFETKSGRSMFDLLRVDGISGTSKTTDVIMDGEIVRFEVGVELVAASIVEALDLIEEEGRQ